MSKILKAVHETARGLHASGGMSDLTMREFDALCLPPVPEFTSTQVTKIRRKVKASQAVFGAFMNVRKSTVAAWNRDQKPSGAAAKLLDLIDRKGLEALT